MTDLVPDSRELDAAYSGFPTFKVWFETSSIEPSRWERYVEILKQRKDTSEDLFQRAREVAKRAAALDTGAIEGLYEVDRGFTFTVATEAAMWEAALTNKGEQVRSLFESQLHAYDYVLDLATKAEPISEAAIRSLHAEICRAQPTYKVITAIGPQDHALPKGEYKVSANHVRTRSGTMHSYAPADLTPDEMARFVGELQTTAFLVAHPVIQAAFAHYAFVVIHPFADGNGRVARALASMFTYRALSLPILILAEHRSPYINALEAADHGNYQEFTDFILARVLDTIKLVDENIRTAAAPAAEDNVAAIRRLYVTRGGYTHDQVDSAGILLVETVAEEFNRQCMKLNAQPVSAGSGHGGLNYVPSQKGYRLPVKGGRSVTMNVATAAPAAANVSRVFRLELPQDAGRDDDLILRDESGELFTARMDELVPTISGVLHLRMTMFVERVLANALAELHRQASIELRKQGY